MHACQSFHKIMLTILIIHVISWVIVQTQTIPGYVCVPAGTCTMPIVINNEEIDLRIITPNNGSSCSSGSVPCQCGIRSVTTASKENGYAYPGTHPWQAYLVIDTKFVGSGVLIDRFHVLTAAHKVYKHRDAPEKIGIHLGVYDSSYLGMRYEVAKVIIRDDYNNVTVFNDIAILRLIAPVSFPQTNISTTCLPFPNQSFVGQSCTVAGWSQTSFSLNDSPTRRQKQVQVTIVDYNTCYKSMSQPSVLGDKAEQFLDKNGEICAGGKENQDACTEDGGSPLVCDINGVFQVAGLVIWGKGCGQEGVYGVYVSVPYYTQWIMESIKQ